MILTLYFFRNNKLCCCENSLIRYFIPTMEYLFGALFIISNTEKKDDKIKAIPIIASLPYFTKLGEAMVTA